MYRTASCILVIALLCPPGAAAADVDFDLAPGATSFRVPGRKPGGEIDDIAGRGVAATRNTNHDMTARPTRYVQPQVTTFGDLERQPVVVPRALADEDRPAVAFVGSIAAGRSHARPTRSRGAPRPRPAAPRGRPGPRRANGPRAAGESRCSPGRSRRHRQHAPSRPPPARYCGAGLP